VPFGYWEAKDEKDDLDAEIDFKLRRGYPKTNFVFEDSTQAVLIDQYKEKTPKDPTIREKFNTYRFADYKDKVIDLLARVTTVSFETVSIVQAMRHSRR
jgi:hypothetical protein